MPGELLRWFETHRHHGIDVVLICQGWKQMTSGLTRLVEVTTTFRKMSRVGLDGKYQGKVRGNCEETVELNSFIGTYKPEVWSFYSSYASATVREVRRGWSLLKSPWFIACATATIASICGVAYLMANPVTLTPEQEEAKKKNEFTRSLGSKLLPPPPTGAAQAQAVEVPPGQTIQVRIEGAVYDGKVWKYMIETGDLLTLAQLAGLTGSTVREMKVGDVRRAVGDGLVWGGKPWTLDELKEATELAQAHTNLRASRYSVAGGTVKGPGTFGSPDGGHSNKVIVEGTSPTYREGQNLQEGKIRSIDPNLPDRSK